MMRKGGMKMESWRLSRPILNLSVSRKNKFAFSARRAADVQFVTVPAGGYGTMFCVTSAHVSPL